jgi:hypothetical protein
MRQTLALAVLFVALASSVYALHGRTAGGSESVSGGFAADFPSGGLLRVNAPSGAVRIVGGSEDRIVVRYGGREPFIGREPKVTLDRSRSGQTGDLEIKGGGKRDYQITVQVPRRSNLRVRMPAGELEVAGVTGDKDISVYSGDVTVEVGEAKQYSRVDASVLAGEISARPFGVETGGLFRSFEVQGGGTYRLRAHIYAGDLTFKN